MPDTLAPSTDVPRPAAPLGVRLEDAWLSFGGTAVFEGAMLDLPPGSWTALLGPSGCGKSSLLRLFLGLPSGEGGRARLTCSDGRPLTGRATMMAQQDLLFPWLTVMENVVIGARLRGDRVTAATTARALALLDAVGLAAAARARPAALSGGMRQRAALARTLMEGRPVVLMDEPFSAVDAITRLRLQALAVQLLADCTVLVVTHDPLEALRLADRIVVMRGRPARLDAALEPALPRPCRVDDPALLQWHGRLLGRLAEAVG